MDRTSEHHDNGPNGGPWIQTQSYQPKSFSIHQGEYQSDRGDMRSKYLYFKTWATAVAVYIYSSKMFLYEIL